MLHPTYSFSSTMKLPIILEELKFNSCGDAYVTSEELVAAGCSESCLSYNGWWMPNGSYRKNPNDLDLKMYSIDR